ncbi:hypothetical protein PV325_000898 [Microctonus aethiopoides]|nr:hypothetical protein PV325_000898 [Microctonus aethiopoides]
MDVMDEQTAFMTEGNFLHNRFESNEYEEEQVYEKDVEEIGDIADLGVTQERLRQIQKGLGLIRLSWPTVQVDDPYLAQLPESYRTTGEKERLLLWYAENFRRQYHTIYSDRKPLIMACDNECGVQAIGKQIKKKKLEE